MQKHLNRHRSSRSATMDFTLYVQVLQGVAVTIYSAIVSAFVVFVHGIITRLPLAVESEGLIDQEVQWLDHSSTDADQGCCST